MLSPDHDTTPPDTKVIGGHTDALEVNVGSDNGSVLHFRHDGQLDGGRAGGRVTGWRRAHVLTVHAGKTKYYEIEPDNAPSNLAGAIAVGTFYVRGRFSVVRKENNPIRARDLWKQTGTER